MYLCVKNKLDRQIVTKVNYNFRGIFREKFARRLDVFNDAR